MRFRAASKLFILAFLTATATAAQPSATDSFPHIPAMSHQTMTYNGKVIYEADVDQNDPNLKPFFLQVRVDSYSGNCTSIVGHVAAAASNDTGERGRASSAYISCVVTELSSDGQAKADIVYDFQNQERNVHESGHVKANLQVGREYKTVSNGSQVTLLMRTY
ncbi:MULTISPECIES: hypothetical protein [Pseudomonas]|uniref:hypothetical protein n=1 Tax=Pseudomonas TaxID=286 RepID=UPI000CD58014|nr:MULTISPECIES: hypothetical protein [Pseudomonas]RBH56046.1 hypothetical protein C3F00_018445 [Pseudomonas sp. MWU13-2860]